MVDRAISIICASGGSVKTQCRVIVQQCLKWADGISFSLRRSPRAAKLDVSIGPRSDLETALDFQITAARLPEPEIEHKFHPDLDWQLDFAWVEHHLAVEVDGGTYSGGRHVRGSGFEGDCEKINAATLMGWRVAASGSIHCSCLAW